MDEKSARAAIEEVEAWWQERRATVAMDTETHNREAKRIEELKARIRARIVPGEPDKKTTKK